MTKKDFEERIKAYKSEIEETRVMRPLSDDEIEWIGNNIDYIPDEYRDAFIIALGGDFSKFEKLPHLLRNYLGALELKRFKEKFDDASSLEREDVRQYLEKRAMHAALRVGISVEKNAQNTRESAMALDTYMNNILMKRTMLPPTEEAKESLAAELGSVERANAAIERNKARQLVMAKAMLLAQLGKYEVIDKNGLSNELSVPIYETLIHGNRTSFILPAGENSQIVIDEFMGHNTDAGIEKRTAATHTVKLRSFTKNGIVKSEGKEQRTYSPLKVFSNQYGMNIAAGGIGAWGPDKKIITGNGESGHMYIRAQKGEANKCASLLIGIEGSAPKADSFLGNTHGILAKSAKQSAFLADKSIVGKKVGGRQIDLSGISAENLTNILNQFSRKYSELQSHADTPEGREKLSSLNDMLMGKRMDTNKLMDMFASLGMTDEGLEDIVSQARSGYLSKINVKDVSADEFTQSIRAKFSQEKACAIAEARFEYAEDDLALAAGAIKELIFTHQTRSLGWKILHPIKNYRENKTISTLLEKLETEKGFERLAIASAFGFCDDTFSMDWGDELSYDRELALFQRVNKYAFKKSDKLVGVLKNVYKELKVDTIDRYEVQKMQAELEKVKRDEPLDDDRESIVIDEANEINPGVDLDMSEEILPPQSIKEHSKEI